MCGVLLHAFAAVFLTCLVLSPPHAPWWADALGMTAALLNAHLSGFCMSEWVDARMRQSILPPLSKPPDQRLYRLPEPIPPRPDGYFRKSNPPRGD
jgi:hypothetical protein